jgi:hypothetical protein
MKTQSKNYEIVANFFTMYVVNHRTLDGWFSDSYGEMC